MRGVFLFVLLVLTTSSVAIAVQVDYELTGTVGTEGSSYMVSADLLENWSCLDLYWGADLNLQPTECWRVEDRWQVRAFIWNEIDLIANHNLDHYTSTDRFRLINKNNYNRHTYSVGLYTEQVQLGFLRHVPFKSLDSVDALFCSSELQLPALLLKTFQLKFAGRQESGLAQVIEGIGYHGPWEIGVALGSQTDSAGAENRGYVFELKKAKPGLEAELSLQRIEPGFVSPLAKSNKYTPNRVGWKLKGSVPLGGLELGFNVRRQSNLERSREYPQLSLKLASKDKNTGLEWRFQPTQAFILHYAEGDTQIRVDPFNYTFRYDTKLSSTVYSFRFDGNRMIARLEVKIENYLDWRLIGKYDFQSARSHYSVLTRYSGEDKYLQLELGQYDRGNMTSGFGNPFSICISWGWKF